MSRLRLFHLSDIHIQVDRPGWRLPDFFSKRVTGWCNLRLRRHRFEYAIPCVERIVEDITIEKPDAVVFSGDATALGFASEVRAAARALLIGNPALPPGIAVPGNHDHYTSSAVRSGDFESVFAPWQGGRKVEPHAYPFARELGGFCFIAVNSCRPNRLAWDASGAVGAAQLERLDRLLGTLPSGPRIVVTHYPYCQGDGTPEPYWHALRDRQALAKILLQHGVRMWLSGHRHKSFVLPPSAEMPFALVCAGSATQCGLAGYMDIIFDNRDVIVQRRAFDEAHHRYQPQHELEVIKGLFTC